MTDILYFLAQTLSRVTCPGLLAILLVTSFMAWLLQWFVKQPPSKRRDLIELIRAIRRR